MELKSKTGRKIRKDSFEAQHDMGRVLFYLKHFYVDLQLSTNQIPLEMEKEYGIKITSGKCFSLIKDMGILRGKSESISLATSTLDYDKSFLDDQMTGIIEGILIGDGTISCNENTKVGRLSIGGCHEEFIRYCHRLLSPYRPSYPKYNKGDGRKGGKGIWSTTTKFHPDFYKIYKKWYVPKKDVPRDIQLTDLMVLLWYLGDGSLSARGDGNSLSLYFSTNSFSKESIEENLVSGLKQTGIETSRITKDNRLFIKTNSIVPLLTYMGGKSPVKCYSYKFDVDQWRLKKTMKEVSKGLLVDYGKLANWVKTGIVEHSRSPGGKKVLFSEQEFNELRRQLDCGELSREKGKRAIRKSHVVNEGVILKKHGEDEGVYLERMAKEFINRGFPYKDYTEAEKQKKWTRLKACQYVVPDTDIIKWRKHGLPLADSFHPHIYELNRKRKISPYSLFNNIDILKQCLKNNNAKNGTMTSPKLLSSVCSDVRSPRLNNFSPSLARDIYNYYCLDGYNVIDPCAGFSGRLLGASVSKRNLKYTGIDPSIRTYGGLVKTKEFLNIVNPTFNCNIDNGCAEDVLEQYRDEYFDFCFTSPPYFDTEEYDTEKNQSYLKFNSYDAWKKCFITKIVDELYRILKPNRMCVINIGKFGKYDIAIDLLSIASTIGFELVEKKNISFPIYGFVKSDRKDRLESMLVFSKK